MRAHIDSSEVKELVHDLEAGPGRLAREAGDLFANEADALQRDMKRQAMNHRHLPKFARALTKQKVDDLHYVVGFNVGPRLQGSLAQIIVFGSVNNAPVYNFYGPITRRAPYFLEHLAKIAEDAVFGDPGQS